MSANELRQKYLVFFKARGHQEIPSAPLVPENDPSVLFTTAGMHPLVPFLLGQTHPAGKKLVDIQKCVRTGDIDDVGDATHHTFFEMLGNWSLGDYFKKKAIEWSYEFLTSLEFLGIDKNKLAVSVFAGDEDAPFDEESFNIWQNLGIPKERIAKLPKKDNWWILTSGLGPCGPATEMFVWAGKNPAPQIFDPEDDRWVEIWNDVFLQFNKTSDDKLMPLAQKNVDTGMGLERILAVTNGLDDDYLTDIFLPIIQKIESVSQKKYDEYKRDFRIIADHLKAAVFIAADKVQPSNQGQGYILRRLIRRAVRKGKVLKINLPFVHLIIDTVVDIYADQYPNLKENLPFIKDTLTREEEKFQVSLDNVEQYRIDLEAAMNHGIIKKIKSSPILSEPGIASGAYVYENFQSYGMPPDLSQEIIAELGLKFNQAEYDEAFKKHQELSRTASAGMFKGGLGEQSEITIKYHTATHLLHAALRKILGESVQQKGSNITSERLRFDFSFSDKLTAEQIKQVENLVNEKIKENLPVTSKIIKKEEALKSGALGFFTDKYGDKVTVYTIGNFSKEICGGPHVISTGILEKFTITKEESTSAGTRRIYATL